MKGVKFLQVWVHGGELPSPVPKCGPHILRQGVWESHHVSIDQSGATKAFTAVLADGSATKSWLLQHIQY
jgi:hypothetical protein